MRSIGVGESKQAFGERVEIVIVLAARVGRTGDVEINDYAALPFGRGDVFVGQCDLVHSCFFESYFLPVPQIAKEEVGDGLCPAYRYFESSVQPGLQYEIPWGAYSVRLHATHKIIFSSLFQYHWMVLL